MASRFLLLMTLSCCDSGTLVVHVTHTSYQAEENQDVTLEWTFTPKPDSSTQRLSVLCEMFTNNKNPILFHLHEGVEVSESQGEEFSGRVQCDKDVLREGRIRLHVSSLRTEDSGLYICDVLTDSGSSSARCHLNVTAAVHDPEDQRPAVGPEPGAQRPTVGPEPGAQRPTVGPEPGAQSRGRIGLYVAVSVSVLLALCALGLCVSKSAPYNRTMLCSLRETPHQDLIRQSDQSLKT